MTCFFAEKTNLKVIEKILLDFLEKEAVECWFNGCHTTFNDQVMETILKIRNEYPEKELKVVDVIDPLNIESDTFMQKKRRKMIIFLKGAWMSL